MWAEGSWEWVATAAAAARREEGCVYLGCLWGGQVQEELESLEALWLLL